jgi:hypothetical protein
MEIKPLLTEEQQKELDMIRKMSYEEVNKWAKNLPICEGKNATDIVPDNGIVRNNFLNQWRMIYNLLANIKTSMDATYQDNGGRITKQHIDSIVEYINMSLDNILGK